MMKIYLLFTVGVLCAFSAYSQPFPVPAPQPDSVNFGRYISRTMNLLHTSTPNNRKKVKVLVYGQSISQQEWWQQTKLYLEKKFPHADIDMQNRSVGGFASQLLVRQMYYDVMPFYPDLVIFHVYGSQFQYDTIVSTIRTQTTAEVAIQNDKTNTSNPDDWADYMSYTLQPKLCKAYLMEYVDLRTQWKKYTTDNNIDPYNLTTDGVHMNEHGNYLYAALTNRYLRYDPKFIPDSTGLVKEYEIGKDVQFINGNLTLPFNGNRVDLIPDKSAASGTKPTVNVTMDNKPLSDQKGCFYFTRPNDSVADWPWGTMSIIKIYSNTQLVEEDWTIRITPTVANSSRRTCTYTITGSKTGFDGSGTLVLSNTNNNWSVTSSVIYSNSGKIIIHPRDWWQPERITTVGTTYFVKFKSKNACSEKYTYPTISDPTLEYAKTVIQGVSNDNHTLQLTAAAAPGIKSIRVYRPFLNRKPTVVTSVNEYTLSELVTMYPNPSAGLVTFALPNIYDNQYFLTVYSALGEKVSVPVSGEGSNFSVDISGLEPGLYITEIRTSQGNVIRKKIIRAK